MSSRYSSRNSSWSARGGASARGALARDASALGASARAGTGATTSAGDAAAVGVVVAVNAAVAIAIAATAATFITRVLALGVLRRQLGSRRQLEPATAGDPCVDRRARKEQQPRDASGAQIFHDRGDA